MADILGPGGIPLNNEYIAQRTQNMIGILGLQLRDYIAIHHHLPGTPLIDPKTDSHEEMVGEFMEEAKARYAFADAMLKVREERK